MLVSDIQTVPRCWLGLNLAIYIFFAEHICLSEIATPQLQLVFEPEMTTTSIIIITCAVISCITHITGFTSHPIHFDTILSGPLFAWFPSLCSAFARLWLCFASLFFFLFCFHLQQRAAPLFPSFEGTLLLTMRPTRGKGAVKKDTKEALKPVEDKRVGKRKAVSKVAKSSKRQTPKGKPAKDPNKPKKPPSAFFVFLEEFRKTYKLEHPDNKAVSAVGKAGGEKWKSLSRAEKAPYEAKAAKRKVEYEKVMSSYNKKQESMDAEGDEESDKSKSEVSGEEDEKSEEDDDDDEEE